MSSWLIRGVEILLLGLLIITWVVGLRKGFPAWALPALGQVLCIMCSVGIYLVFPAQEFATPDLSFRLWESLQPVLLLPALLILLCLPALLPYLPLGRTHALANGG